MYSVKIAAMTESIRIASYSIVMFVLIYTFSFFSDKIEQITTKPITTD